MREMTTTTAIGDPRLPWHALAVAPRLQASCRSVGARRKIQGGAVVVGGVFFSRLLPCLWLPLQGERSDLRPLLVASLFIVCKQKECPCRIEHFNGEVPWNVSQ